MGWKRALLDGVRPVGRWSYRGRRLHVHHILIIYFTEVEYAYNRTSSLALQCMINACRNLEALDLTTPVLACLARDGRMIGIVKCIEEGARIVSYKDRALVCANSNLRALHFLTRHRFTPHLEKCKSAISISPMVTTWSHSPF